MYTACTISLLNHYLHGIGLTGPKEPVLASHSYNSGMNWVEMETSGLTGARPLFTN